MKMIEPSYEILTPINYEETLKQVEKIGRVCYKSESRIDNNSSKRFVKMIINRGHESILEHISITVRFVCDRAIANEIVRHRIASYAQESTRYVRYDDEITVITPDWWREVEKKDSSICLHWIAACEKAEYSYKELLKEGSTAQQARAVLPHSLKTELIMTANIRQWRHFFRLRDDKAAHPQMVQLVAPLKKELLEKMPIFFENL